MDAQFIFGWKIIYNISWASILWQPAIIGGLSVDHQWTVSGTQSLVVRGSGGKRLWNKEEGIMQGFAPLWTVSEWSVDGQGTIR